MNLSSSVRHRPLLVLSNRPWNQNLAERLSRNLKRTVLGLSSPSQLSVKAIEELDPEWIFVPHWSHLIPESIWGRWATVIFHMTDLPYGRGGSPLQNLIQKGHSRTALTALSCCGEVDAGDIYLKKELSLDGSAEEIFLRADFLIEEMIECIVKENISPEPQIGEVVTFKRRTPEMSNLLDCDEGSLASWYNKIRMLDAENYPHAFLEINGIRLEFRRVSQRSDGLYADVKIASINKIQHRTDQIDN